MRFYPILTLRFSTAPDRMKRQITLLAHNIRSLWNIGSLFRTADAFDVEQILLSGYTALPDRTEVKKTALGAESWVPWKKVSDPLEAMAQLRRDGYKIIALELSEKSLEIQNYRSSGPVCLVIGHEILGVPKNILDTCDEAIQIPMLGRKNSLNVSVAAGIALYHLSLICP